VGEYKGELGGLQNLIEREFQKNNFIMSNILISTNTLETRREKILLCLSISGKRGKTL
jgi:hypothetical protein